MAEPEVAQMDRKRRFELLALPHLDAAYNLARWLTGSGADAEDVAQEAYLRAYRYFESWQGQEIRVWLLTITRHCFLAWVQRNRDRRLVFGLEQDTEAGAAAETMWGQAPSTPETLLLRRQDAATLERLIQDLPPDYREVLVLREIEELAYQEIAQVVGAPLGTVMSRLARARAMLRKRWRRGDAGTGK
jgi:RNA polymerase sigma-70 factor (ECF subfamily)